MKRLLSALLIVGSTSAWSQSLPFDFESATSGMAGYDNASFTIVNNPSTTGNSSSKVAEIVKTTAGDLWAGGVPARRLDQTRGGGSSVERSVGRGLPCAAATDERFG